MEENRKYSLLIVDDEPVISDGIKELFEENFGSVFQIYHCYHPKKALEIFKYRLCDVVVSDVKMPKMTGIEMAEEMRKIKPDLHVLFLSGYDEFEYVYSAIRQDADDYILKTEGDEAIVGAMKKMVALLDSEHIFMREYQTAKNRLSYMAPAFKQQALMRILEGDISTEEEFHRLMEELKHPLPEQGSLLLLLGTAKEKTSQGTQEQILETVDQLLRKSYGEKIGYIHKVMYRKYFVWILETEEKQLPELLFVTALDLQKMIQTSLKLKISFGIAEGATKWNGLSAKFFDLREEMQRRSLGEEDSIILENRKEREGDAFNGEEGNFASVLLPVSEKMGLLEEFISEENFSEFESLMGEILEILSNSRRHSMYALEIYNHIANLIISFINRKNIRVQLASKIQLMELFDPGSFSSWKQACEYLKKLTEEIREVCRISNENVITGISEKTKAYILSHLPGDLSLTAVGQAMGFNPVYLSRIFKQTEGIGIREYVENCRMEMARKMIVGSRMKIYEVAEKCGYQNTAYFIKIFKAHFGMTPQECRDGKF